jgi:ABC-2 type transport system permease protein
MRNVWALIVKELRLYFQSPTAYVVMTAFLLLAGYFFYGQVTDFARFVGQEGWQYMNDPQFAEGMNVNEFVMTPFLQSLIVLLLLVIPILTMRGFAEEKKLGTDELLLTSPISVNEVVAGKFLAALIFYGGLLLLTVHFPGVLLYKGAPPDPGLLASSYLGLLLIGGTFISFGLFASSLTSDQIVAAVTSFAVLLLFWVIGWLSDSVAEPWNQVLKYVAVTSHLDGFMEGAIRLPDVVFYVTLIFLSLFLTARAFESARWR